jgi:hypothetical protein
VTHQTCSAPILKSNHATMTVQDNHNDTTETMTRQRGPVNQGKLRVWVLGVQIARGYAGAVLILRYMPLPPDLIRSSFRGSSTLE